MTYDDFLHWGTVKLIKFCVIQLNDNKIYSSCNTLIAQLAAVETGTYQGRKAHIKICIFSKLHVLTPRCLGLYLNQQLETDYCVAGLKTLLNPGAYYIT